MFFLESASRQASLQKFLLGLCKKTETPAIRAIVRKLEGAKYEKTRPEKRLRKNQGDIVLKRSLVCI